jgi:hypothetical protein
MSQNTQPESFSYETAGPLGDVQAALMAAAIGEVAEFEQDSTRRGYLVLNTKAGEQKLVVPQDHPAAEHPRALSSACKFLLLSELAAHIQVHGSTDSVAFVRGTDIAAGNTREVSVEAFLDFPLKRGEIASWGRTRATASIVWSPNAVTWLGGWSGAQKDLANLLSDLAGDIYEAPSTEGKSQAGAPFGLTISGRAALLEAAKQLKVTQTHEVQEAVDMRNGSASITFKNTSGGTSVMVPEAVLVKLTDVEEQVAVDLVVAVRYEVKDGKLAWTLKPMGVRTVERDFRRAVAQSLAGYGINVQQGTAAFTAL